MNKKPEPEASKRGLYNEHTYPTYNPKEYCRCPDSEFERGEQKVFLDTGNCTHCFRPKKKLQ